MGGGRLRPRMMRNRLFISLSCWAHYGKGNPLGFFFTQANFRWVSDWSAWAAGQLQDAGEINPLLPVYLSINVVLDSPSVSQIQDAGIELCQSEADGVFMWEWRPEDFEALRPAMEAIASACGE